MGEEQVNKEDLSWLVTVPASDIDFKQRLRFANDATVRAALEQVKSKKGSTTKLNAPRLLRKRRGFLRNYA